VIEMTTVTEVIRGIRLHDGRTIRLPGADPFDANF
jgi:hypothetical protein